MTRAQRTKRLRQIADRIQQIDRELHGLCPFTNRSARLNTERIALRQEAATLTRGAPEA